MFSFQLDKKNGKPLYQQIVEFIEETILTGRIKPGEKLPSERDMSLYFKVNRSTVVRAMEILHDRNIVIRQVGSGTYINPQKWGRFFAPEMNWRTNNLAVTFSDHFQYDLANGDLPTALYPNFHLPEIEWQLLVEAEQEQQASKLGTQGLRQAVQRYLMDRFSWNVDLHQILITSGTQQAISLITLGLLKTGDAIAIENPSYFYSLSIFQALGIRIYGIPMDANGVMIDKLDALVDKYSIKMVFINPIFHNPTGMVMSPLRKKHLIEYCERKQLLIIEDDAYSQLSFSPSIDCSPIKKLDVSGNTLYLGSLSKYIGKSIRIGWMVAPASIVEHLANIRLQLESGLSSLPQFMAEHYLTQYALEHEKKLAQALKIRAENLTQWLQHHFRDDLLFSPPLGGFHLYTQSMDHATSKNIEKKLQELACSYRKGDFFGDNSPHFRLSFAHFAITQTP